MFTNKMMMAVAIMATGLGFSAPAMAAGQGETLFKQRCQMCHTNAPGGRNGIGPNLAGVGNRAAASVSGFNYSPKLKASGLTWNAANLDKFLSAPSKMVPGTRMVISLPDPTARKTIVTYLTTGK